MLKAFQAGVQFVQCSGSDMDDAKRLPKFVVADSRPGYSCKKIPAICGCHFQCQSRDKCSKASKNVLHVAVSCAMLSLISSDSHVVRLCAECCLSSRISYLQIRGHWVWAPNAVAASSPTCFADAVQQLLVDAVAAPTLNWQNNFNRFGHFICALWSLCSLSPSQDAPTRCRRAFSIARNAKKKPQTRSKPSKPLTTCMDLKSMQVNLVNMKIPDFDGHPLQYLGVASGKIHLISDNFSCDIKYHYENCRWCFIHKLRHQQPLELAARLTSSSIPLRIKDWPVTVIKSNWMLNHVLEQQMLLKCWKAYFWKTHLKWWTPNW